MPFESHPRLTRAEPAIVAAEGPGGGRGAGGFGRDSIMRRYVIKETASRAGGG